MKWVSKLDQRFGGYGIANITLYLVAGQILAYVYGQARPGAISNLSLQAAKVLEGEVWRVVTFLFVPAFRNALGLFFGWYMLGWMGTALERIWGTFRYNLFLLIGWLATALVSLFDTDAVIGNGFIQLSVLVTFAYLNPDFTISLYAIVPIRASWLAAFSVLVLIATAVFGSWGTRLAALASVSNFLLFFGDELWQSLLRGKRRISRRSRGYVREEPQHSGVYHRCTVCGITDQSHPKMDFRYCSKCEGTYGYCSEHLKNHEHIRATPAVCPLDGGARN